MDIRNYGNPDTDKHLPRGYAKTQSRPEQPQEKTLTYHMNRDAMEKEPAVPVSDAVEEPIHEEESAPAAPIITDPFRPQEETAPAHQTASVSDSGHQRQPFQKPGYGQQQKPQQVQQHAPSGQGSVHHQPQPQQVQPEEEPTGVVIVSGKRFFGQLLLDQWTLRINGQQELLPFGKNKLTLEVPAGWHQVTAFTNYLGLHCMRAVQNIFVPPNGVVYLRYDTVFDIYKAGKLTDITQAVLEKQAKR